MTRLHVENLHASLGNKPILHDINVSLDSGQLLGIIGMNGAGKTTLLHIMAGLLPPSNGNVWLDGEALERINHLSRRIAYLEQSAHCHWPLEVENLVELGRLPYQGFASGLSPADKEAVENALQEADILHLRHRTVTQLSNGEQARVHLARALAVDADILLADEPTDGLDPAHQLLVMELLRKKAQQGKAVACILHDLPLAARFCTTLALLHEGRIVAYGTPADVLFAENLRLTLQVEILSGSHENAHYVLPWRAVAEPGQ